MKMKKAIIITLIVMMVAVLGLGSIIPSLAVADERKNLSLSYFRYANGEPINGYRLNIINDQNNTPIFQIMSSPMETNYYCLNAAEGVSWRSKTTGTPIEYNREYDLNSSSDINQLEENETNSVYKNIGKSDDNDPDPHLNHILWILDNMYVPNKDETAESNLARKRELLAKAGIVFGAVDNEDINGNQVGEGYKYIAQTDYDYSDTVSDKGKKGYFYYDPSEVYHQVELTDDIVQVAQQAALWYFTNFLENNSDNSIRYDVRTYGLQLACSNGTTNTNANTWYGMTSDNDDSPFNHTPTNASGKNAEIETWQQEMATVLCWYLIDAANNYANSGKTATGNPLKMQHATVELAEKTVSGTDYYVVGPMTIDEVRTAVYSLNNTIFVNGNELTEAYISDANGNQESNQTISSHIGQEFYIAVPKSRVAGRNIQISFKGTYKTNEKKLRVSTTNSEQPVVEVTPKNEPFVLEVATNKDFDLALRKVITDLKDSNGNSKLITNEKTTSNIATRNVTVNTNTISSNGTATYNHRKDPVVVEKGDIITYSITVYNEGDMKGYATTIIDKLPNGLALKGYTENETTRGTINGMTYNPVPNGTDGGAVPCNYSYEYNPRLNEIVLTNESKNVLEAYGDGIASEKIEIECEVTQVPSSSTNTYLTNIAYIAGAHNKETEQDVVQDRDSNTNNNPSATQNVTGDKYPDDAYHGGDNHNHNNDKDVYNDGTNNDDYFPGREDDDDFEIVVVKPAVFDLALQKYISSVISADGTTKQGRNAPTINTEGLANKTATTATYTQDKTPLKVKSGDYVLYTFTVYNEGELEGYVNKITDNIPTGLQFVYAKVPQDGRTVVACDSQGNMTEIEVSSNIYQNILNNNGCWSIDSVSGTETLKKDTYNGESTVSVTCDVKEYLDGTNKLLNPYSNDSNSNYDGTGLDRTSVTLLLRVNGQNGTGSTIRNEAAITEATDKDGNKQDITDTGLKDRDSQTNQWKGKDGDKDYQDDEDYDSIILGKVDLALTKFITAISDDVTIENGEYLTANGNEGSKTNPYTRQTAVNTTPLKNGTSTDAIYTQVKTPLTIPENSYVLYNIRVYNEGDVDVYAGEVKDYLPEYLTFVENAPINNEYGWTISGKTLTTNYLSKENGTDKILEAFDKETDDGAGSKLDYKDLPVLCRVSSDAPNKTKLINSAEITKYEDENGDNIEKDIDSTPSNLDDTEKNKEGNPDGRYDEDDEDYEVVETRKKRVDLALSKFIAAISDDVKIMDGEYLTANGNKGSKENPYTRATAVDTKELRDNEECHDATYTKVKDPLTVPAQSYVLYDIRVYNEGETDVFAGEVTDYLPEYLDYVDCEFNNDFKWTVASDGKTISTTYLSHANGEENLLKAFDKKTDDGKGSGLDYRDLQILCKVNDQAPSNTNLVNVAEITKYENKDGDPIPDDDIDSKPKNVDEKNEDDDDYETVLIRTFDLSLLKYVSEVYVTEDGKTTTTQTGNTGDNNTDIIPKVEINKKKLSSTVVKFGYTIKITNEGDIEGYAKEITDYVPEGLKFYAEDNNGWTDEGNNVISTRLLENTLLKPGESAEVKVIFRWINGSNNLGLKTNIAEISEDYNKEGVPDRDSTPDNRKEGEDDIDDAKVILSIKTGLIHNVVMYTTVGLIILVVMGAGITAIKKYVL